MDSPFKPLIDVIHSSTIDTWKERNENALAALFGTRYAKRAEKSVALRAPDMKGSDSGVPYAAYIHPSNTIHPMKSLRSCRRRVRRALVRKCLISRQENWRYLGRRRRVCPRRLSKRIRENLLFKQFGRGRAQAEGRRRQC